MHDISLFGIHQSDALYDFDNIVMAGDYISIKGLNSSLNAQVHFKY